MSNSLTIWSNVHYPPEVERRLLEATAGDRLIWSDRRHASNLAAGQVDPKLAEADIAFGQPDPRSVLESPRLRWVHLTTAGYTRYDTDDFRTAARAKGLMLTTSSTVYAEPCAQHLAGFIYAHSRCLFDAARAQLTTRDWDSAALRRGSTLLGGQRVLIYGFGTIARRLVELIAPLRLHITGVRRRPAGDEGIAVVTIEQAEQLLPVTDIIVNVLPANRSSERFFSADRIGRMKAGAIFMNIGRGTTVDQAALQRALETRQLSAAWLDVTDPEPLPPDHPLWRVGNCHITPHTAGGFSAEHESIVHHFINNLLAFRHGKPLVDRVM